MAEKKSHIYLTGFMGSGKTSMGKALADISGSVFFDMDNIVEGSQNMKIADIFKVKGEPYFRELEHRLLVELEKFEPCIIATGGGVPCDEQNLQLMKRSGVVVYMKCTTDELFQWLEINKGDRPLLAGKEGVELLAWIEAELQRREVYYEQADIIVDGYHISPEDLWEKIIALRA